MIEKVARDEVHVRTSVPDTVKVLVPVGSLGAGVQENNVRYGLDSGAHAIASDAGSTDSGAAYLALGISKYSREAVKRDLRILMTAQAEAHIPILIGSCGQSGGDTGLEWTRDIAIEIARERGLTPRIAVIYSEQDRAMVKAKNARGQIHPLPPHGPLSDATIDGCVHIVAAMGPEPYIAALEEGADIILGGRTTDPAVLAAMPLWRGTAPASAWHAGKIGECGSQCTVNPASGKGVLLRVADDWFEVEPLALQNHCSPHSVSAHMLYENSDPFHLTEPGGVLDVTGASYEQLDDRAVRVTGARWEPRPYTMKLEGAAPGPFQTIMLVGIEDPGVLSQLDLFHDRLHAALCQRVGSTLGDEAGDYHISLRLDGWNAVSGRPVPPATPPPRQVGVLCVITAATQSLASRIAKACNPYFFHFPITQGIELPSYGFAFSPAEIDRGCVYEFKLNHVVEVNDPLELVRTNGSIWKKDEEPVAKVRDVCRHVRSKNAGAFWVTIDLFFDGHDNYLRYSRSESLGPAAIASLYGADPALVKRVPVESLDMVKISYPRTSPQGGIVERDMHSGQQFVRLLDVELD